MSAGAGAASERSLGRAAATHSAAEIQTSAGREAHSAAQTGVARIRQREVRIRGIRESVPAAAFLMFVNDTSATLRPHPRDKFRTCHIPSYAENILKKKTSA